MKLPGPVALRALGATFAPIGFVDNHLPRGMISWRIQGGGDCVAFLPSGLYRISASSTSGLSMYPSVTQTQSRGVSCKRCGKPIRLSASFLKREEAVRQDESRQKLSSKVFSARCRRCPMESIYELSQIVDFPLVPHDHHAHHQRDLTAR